MGGHRKGRRRRRLLRRALYVTGGLVAGLVATIWIMYARTKVPPVNAAAQARASVFAYRDGGTLAQVGRLNRVPVRLNEVPVYVRGAVLAAEDRGFYHDPVISPRGLTRAVLAAVSGGPRQGGSGITQQYVKVAYLNPEQTLSRKVKELFVAVKISRSRSKDWIFQQYLNTVYFGRGAYGIQAASQAYFRKNVGALTPAEGALLAGVIQAPSYLDPAQGHIAGTRARWRYVLDGMMKTGVLPKAPLPAFPAVAPAHTQPMYAGQRGYLIERIIDELHARGFDDDQIYRRGLRVTTTIDSRLQAAAPEAVRQATHDKDIEAGLASVVPGTGDIVAEYGGRDYLRHQYDNAFLAALPPGSSFDPFVLATALHRGVGLLSTFDASPLGTVVNDDDAQATSANLVRATALSYNTVFARLGRRVGASCAARAGLRGHLPPRDVHAIDQAAAYAALASGTYATPHILVKVTDTSGRVLLKVRPHTRPAFSPAVRADVTFALRVAMRTSGRDAELPDRAAAGVIGTTDHNAAGWFNGYTPDLATTVVAYRASNRPLVNIGNAPRRSSAAVPKRIWRAFMTGAEAGRPVRAFPAPAWVGRTVDFAPPRTDGRAGGPADGPVGARAGTAPNGTNGPNGRTPSAPAPPRRPSVPPTRSPAESPATSPSARPTRKPTKSTKPTAAPPHPGEPTDRRAPEPAG